MADYLQVIAGQLGISIWLLVVLFIWSSVWKALALWKSARRKSIPWFIILFLVNTAGILEILYIFVFSECFKPKRAVKQKTRRKKGR